MNMKSKILCVSVVFLFTSVACVLPFVSNTGPSQSTPTATLAAPIDQVTPTLAAELASSVTPVESQESTPKQVDFSQVVLTQADLPAGFQVLDAEAQKQLKVTPDDISNLFQNSFTQAKPTSYFAFLNPSTDSYQFVLGTLFLPLTPTESAGFDNQLNDPSKATQSFVSGMGGNAIVINGADRFGERSIGFTFTVDAQTMTLRGDMVLARRGDVVMLLLSMYQDGIKPSADILTISALLDKRLKDALTP
jgi:hypothetical protein